MPSILNYLDFYKLTMSQQAYAVARDAEVTFTLKNRANLDQQSLITRVTPDALTRALRDFQHGFTSADTEWLSGSASGAYFPWEYRGYLGTHDLPTPKVFRTPTGELGVEVTGPWPLVTYWETVVMSVINELYFRQARDLTATETTGHERLGEAIRIIREHPSVKITDFGTRRRFSLDWHRTVVRRLSRELHHSQFLGTSNPGLAREFEIPVIGTYAHELPMVYAALAEEQGADILDSHARMLDDWYLQYKEQFSIALTDTFGSDFFFRTFTEDRARYWKGLRHDSGDPFEFGYRAIKFYEKHNFDPTTKTVVFSDGLDLNKILDLDKEFGQKLNVTYGWGTGLTNNVGVKPLNIVMKATAVNGVSTVKLSDDEGKHTGTDEAVGRYKKLLLDRYGIPVVR